MFKLGLKNFIHTHVLSRSFPTHHDLVKVTKMHKDDEKMIEPWHEGKQKKMASPTPS